MCEGVSEPGVAGVPEKSIDMHKYAWVGDCRNFVEFP